MVYVKHPEHGNRHVSAEKAQALAREGWVIWPRSKEQKAGIAAPDVPVPAGPVVLPVLNVEQVIKRKPGRPRKEV